MGRKVNPEVFRLGKFYPWDSRWFAEKDYRQDLLEDFKIRQTLEKMLKSTGLAKVEIERLRGKMAIIIHVSRPGMVIGRQGAGLEEIKKILLSILDLKKAKNAPKIEVKVEAVKEPSLEAQLLAQSIAEQLIKRLPHRRVVKQALERVMAAGAKGVRIVLSGRIAGAEISRREKYQRGSMPLTTLRAKIDFAVVPALTKSGYIGVKVWICKK